MGTALPGILGTLQVEGHGRADLEQSGLQHSMRSFAGDQTHSWPSTERKSPGTGIISSETTFLRRCSYR